MGLCQMLSENLSKLGLLDQHNFREWGGHALFLKDSRGMTCRE